MNSTTARAWVPPALVAILAATQLAWAGGVDVPNQGARATAQGDAFAAQADDPSAIYYNPAGLTQLEGTQVMAGIYPVFPDWEFQGAAGGEHHDKISFIPHFYASTDLFSPDWRFGLGLNNVFGVSVDWGDDGQLRNTVTDAELSVINIAPTVAYRVNDNLSLGLAFNIYHGELELNTKLPLPTPPEGAFRIEGDGEAFGVTLGTLWKINQRHSLGLVYRSPFTIEFDGTSRIDRRPALPIIGPSDTTADIDFPQIIVAGYAFRPTEKLKLEVDVQWADWDTLDEVHIDSADPVFSSLPPEQFHYDDSFTYRFGLAYQLDRAWTVRAGYIFSEGATPNRTFTPAVLDPDRHIFTAGFGYSTGKWELALAYHFLLSDDHTVTNSVNSPPGEYSDRSQTVMLSLIFRF